MADSDPGERNYDNMLKMLSDLNKDLEKLLEEMEKISGRMFFQAGYLPPFQELKFSVYFQAQIKYLLNQVFPDYFSTYSPCDYLILY